MMEKLDKFLFDYDCMVWVIEYLDICFGDQLSLDDFVGEMGLSLNWVQCVFCCWVGFILKQFVSFVMMNWVRLMLENGESVLNVVYDVGLFGFGRLYDLCI